MQAGARDEAHARLVEVMPALFRRLVIGLPNEVEGVAKVTTEQYGVLTHVLERGSVSMREVAVARNVALNTATSLVDRLVAAGLVERRGDPGDRRVVRVALTPRGVTLMERLRTIRRAAVRGVLDELSDEEIERVLAALPALARLAGLRQLEASGSAHRSRSAVPSAAEAHSGPEVRFEGPPGSS